MSMVRVLVGIIFLGVSRTGSFAINHDSEPDYEFESIRKEGFFTSNERLFERRHIEPLFKKFAAHLGRSYVNDTIGIEYEKRLEAFQASLKRHADLNEEESNLNGSALYGINQFSDWTPAEFKAQLLGSRKFEKYHEYKAKYGFPSDIVQLGLNSSDQNGQRCAYLLKDPPSSVDWRLDGNVTAVKNQGKCGSCWAFTAAEQVESYWSIASLENPLTKFSVQEFLSCAPSLGCGGGNTCHALLWLAIGIYKGKYHYYLVPDSEYPYEDKDTSCKYDNIKKIGAKISSVCGCQSFVGREYEMLRLVAQKGPLAINVDAVLWHDYVSGIIQRHCSNLTMNHAVQLIGYDLALPVPYWIIKNSWGPKFGENGYLRVKYGENMCGVAEEPSFIII